MKKRIGSLVVAAVAALALLAPPVVAVEINSDMASWTYRASAEKGNSYKLSSDKDGTFLQSEQPKQALKHVGSATQEVAAAQFAGKRVRLSAMIKANAVGSATLLLQNATSRPVYGTIAWKRFSVVADIPEKTPTISLGVSLAGGGKLWFKQFTLDEIAKVQSGSVASGTIAQGLPKTPDFSPESKQWTCHTSKSPGRCDVDQGASYLEQQSQDPTDYIASFQDISAASYAGKRVKFTGSLKTAGVTDWSGLWMRVDSGARVQAFDNMADRPVKGDTNWTQQSVVLDVPQSATRVRLGFMLAGSGKAWMKDLRLDVVDSSVPVTAETTP